MKILILANDDFGLYKFRRELIIELLKDHQVVLALPYGRMVDLLVEDGCCFYDTSIDRRGVNPITDLKLLLNYFKIIHNEKPDLVITYTIKPNIYGGLVCCVSNTNYALNITGLGTAFETDNWLKKLVVRLYRFASKKAKVVFFENSENERVFLDNKIIKSHQAKLLNGAGVNIDYYTYQHYPRNKEFRFLYVGRVMKEKGIDELFDSMKRLVHEYDCCLDLVGPLEENYSDVIQKYCKEGWLNYYGFQEDVRPFIKHCNCFVLPSYHEGMANTNLECAASGRPIITTSIPGCMEAVCDGSGLLCLPKDSDSLFFAMKTMIEKPCEERESMGVLGRKHMEEFFDKNNIVKQTMKHLLGTDYNE